MNGGGVLSSMTSWNLQNFGYMPGGIFGDYLGGGGGYGWTIPFGSGGSSSTPTAAYIPSTSITTSPDLPGSTHWDPAPVPVGEKKGGSAPSAAVILGEGGGLPGVGVFLPHVIIEDQPPIIFSPAPIILPGQVDPGREEQESEEGEMAHTWLHLGSQIVGGLFPDQNPLAYNPGLGFTGGPGQVGGSVGGGAGTPAPGTVGGSMAEYESGSCARKTRTLTIDCATGLEVKRKRRRRRALLTQGDMGVLFQIASLPNNANVRVALAGAIRR